MAEELRSDRSSSSAPSADPLDAALERMEAARSAAQATQGNDQGTELESDEDETTGTDTTAESQPDDEDFEEDDETDEAHTPGPDADDEESTQSTEAQQQKKPAQPASKVEDTKKQAQGTDAEDDDRPLSRKQRGKLIQELRQELEHEQQQKRDLEDSLRKQREEDERLGKEVDRALGTKEEFERALEEGLAGDEEASKRARIWKSNREFYKKLVDKAQRDHSSGFMQSYWNQVAGLPGVTEKALKAPTLAEILKNMYDAGAASVQSDSSEQAEKLQEELNTWKGRYKKLKLQAGGQKTSPLGGGGSTAAERPVDWRSKYIKNGVLTDEAEAIVDRYGFEALQNPKLIKAR